MHSADYAVAGYSSVCPSVCLSHAGILSTTLNIGYPKKIQLGRRAILVFLSYQTGWQYSDGDPITGASNARGIKKITIFEQYLALSPK